MAPYFQDSHVIIYNKDCRAMTELPDECAQMICTSPPYWGLRKYSGEQEIIWGDNHCEHEWIELATLEPNAEGGASPKQDTVRGSHHSDYNKRQRISNTCSLCSAWKGAFGLEPTPELYIQHSIEILREVRRVLRKDGVVFWNIGDSYSSGDRKTNKPQTIAGGNEQGLPLDYSPSRNMGKHLTIKPKDLCLIPFRLAIAAQEDGWWVRSIIIWNKPNPMPESVTDRPTESHEYILMLTKSGTTQYWTHRDSGGTRQKPKPDYRWTNRITEIEVAIKPPNWKEKIICPDCAGTGNVDKEIGWYSQEEKCSICNGKGKTTLWKRINLWSGHDYYWDADAVREEYTEPMNRWGGETLKRDTSKTAAYKEMQNIGYSSAFRVDRPMRPNPAGRNIRSVWEFPTQPYPEAHFAVFPEKLPELCIKAATPEVGCCSNCGAPWARVVEVRIIKNRPSAGNDPRSRNEDRLTKSREIFGSQGWSGNNLLRDVTTLGWQPTCKCGKYTCINCQEVVLYPYREDANATQRFRSKKSIPSGVGKEEISGERDSQAKSPSPSFEISQGLRPMREIIQGQEGQPILQSDLLNEMDVGTWTRQQGNEGQALGFATSQDTDKSRLYQDKDARISTGRQSGLCIGTPISNGEKIGQIFNSTGASASQEWDKERQQRRESPVSSEGAYRSSMPSMSAHLPNKETCPNCGTLDFLFEPSYKVPSIVLDPFAGAGTTLWVAKKLGRRAVGYDISEEYCELALDRNRQGVLAV